MYVCILYQRSWSQYMQCSVYVTLHLMEPVFAEVVAMLVCVHCSFLACAVQEVESLRVKGSRVEKLQAELSSQKERFEEVDLLRSKLKEMKLRHEQTLEGKAKIEDEVEMLRSKVTLLEDIQADHAQLKAQCDALTSVGGWVAAPCTGTGGLGWKLLALNVHMCLVVVGYLCIGLVLSRTVSWFHCEL